LLLENLVKKNSGNTEKSDGDGINKKGLYILRLELI
jgi:hypothetical protein